MGSKADVTLLNFDVRFTPESGHQTAVAECLLWAKMRHRLFDQLVGGDEQTRRHGQAEGLRCFHVDDSFVLGRRLNGKIDRFSAAQDAVDIGRHLSKLIYAVGAGQDV